MSGRPLKESLVGNSVRWDTRLRLSTTTSTISGAAMDGCQFVQGLGGQVGRLLVLALELSHIAGTAL